MGLDHAAAQARARLADVKSALAAFNRDNLAMVSGSMEAITRSRDLLHRTRRTAATPLTKGNGDRDPPLDFEPDVASQRRVRPQRRTATEIGEAAMDRKIIARDLHRAKQHVREGAAHIRKQRRVVDELSADGHDTRLARDLLQTFESMEAAHVDDRARLSDELARADLEDETKPDGKTELGTHTSTGSKR